MKTLDFNSKLAIAKTHVSGDSFRPVLGAVLHDEDKLVSTDTCRMLILDAGIHAPAPIKLDPNDGKVFQGAPVYEKVRGWALPDGDPNDGTWHKVIKGYTGGDGMYPQWRRVVPNLGTEISLTVTVAELTRALKEISPAAKESANRCRLKFSAGIDAVIVLSARATVCDKKNTKDVKEWQLCTQLSGAMSGAMEIAFNYRYMLDVCKVAKLHGDTSINLRFIDNSRAFEVVPADWMDGEPAWKVILMPVALD